MAKVGIQRILNLFNFVITNIETIEIEKYTDGNSAAQSSGNFWP